MPDLSGLGDLVLTVGGDISPLEQSLNQIPAVAQQSAAQIQAAFDAIPSATDEVETSMANLSKAVQDAGTAATEATAPLAEMTRSASDGATQAAHSIGEMPPALHDTAAAAHEAESSLGEFIKQGLELAGIVISLEAIKEALVGSLEKFGEFQRAGEALTAITGNAKAAAEAMERIPQIADQLGVSIGSLEQAQQRLALFGVSLQNIPAALNAIADASRAAGVGFDDAASAFERMDNTGKIMPRTLQALGLNMQDIAKAMEMVGAENKDVQKAFEDLGSASDRAAVLVAAAEAKMGGIAQQTANDVVGSWQQVQNAIHEAMVNIGDALAGLSQSGGMSILKDAIKGVETFVVSLIGYLGQAIDLVKGFGTIAATEFSAVGKAATDAAHGEFAKAWQDLKAGNEQMVQDFEAMGAKMKADWDANGQIIDKIWSSTAADVNTSSKSIADGLHQAAAAQGEVAASAQGVADAITKFVGPVYQANQGIVMMNGAMIDTADHAAAQMQNGVEVLNGTVSTLVDTFDAAKVTVIGAGDAFEQTAADLQDYVNGATSATAATDNLSQAAADAAGSVQSLGDALNQTMAGPSEGGGTLGMHLSLAPGDQYSSVFTGNPFRLVGVGTPSLDEAMPKETQTFDPRGTANFQRAWQNAQQALADAAKVQTDAGKALTEAAQWQESAAQQQADAAKMAASAAQAAQQANDSISASTLAAADAANALALAGDAVVSTVQSTATVVAGATAIVMDVAAKAGIPGFTSGGSNALTTALTSAPSLPSLGPSGANSLVPMVPFVGGYSPTVSPQLTVNAGTVVGANGMNDLTQMIQKALVDMLNQQGIRVVRG